MHWRTMDEIKNAPFSSSCPQRLFEAVGGSESTHHPTHFTWRYYTPPTTPHPPFCQQQRNLQRSNIFQPSNIFQDSTSSNALHMTLLHPPHPPSVNNSEACNVATSSNQAKSSRIQHHPTHFTWRYYTPPPPPPPPSVNNNKTCNVATSSNQATSSRIQHHPTHFTWRYYTPPPKKKCIKDWS